MPSAPCDYATAFFPASITMATPAHTFPCPFCGRRMGVRAEMLGRRVRCPHCAQIVLAPSPVAQPAKPISHTSPTPPSTPAPVPPAEGSDSQNTDQDGSKITFDTKKEAADSILSDQHDSDDEVFSTQTGSKIQVPAVPEFDPDPTSGPPPAQHSASKIPTLELRTPVEIIPAPISASTLLPPQPPPPPLEAASLTPTAQPMPLNPFAFDAGLSSPVAISGTSPAQDAATQPPFSDENHSPPSARAKEQVATYRPPPSRWLLYTLVSYATIMTVVAVYGLFFRSQSKPDPGHPLSTIPDTFGEFDPATRKRVGQLRLDFDAPLPEHQMARLGERLPIGQLEVEPVAVEKRPLTIVREVKGAADPQRRKSRFDSLVLKLRVKNSSADRPIFPLDPAFTRSARMDDRPAMRLAIGRQTLYGGAISWPFAESVRREYEEAQARDNQPLRPGETREYVVFTNEDSSLVQVLRKAGEPLLWRVQLRRGVVEHGGREVPVTAIVGIEFQASEIRNLD